MENTVIAQRSKKQSSFAKTLFKNREIPFKKQKPETLEAKICRLYTEGHYSEEKLQYFFEIPGEHRVDPFEISPSGDVYYADQRNVDYVNENITRGRKDMEEGKITVVNDFYELWERL